MLCFEGTKQIRRRQCTRFTAQLRASGTLARRLRPLRRATLNDNWRQMAALDDDGNVVVSGEPTVSPGHPTVGRSESSASLKDIDIEELLETLQNASFDEKRRRLEQHQQHHTYGADKISMILNLFKNEGCTMSEAMAIVLKRAQPMTCKEAIPILGAAVSDEDRLDLLQKIARILTDSEFADSVSVIEDCFSSDDARAAAREMLIRFEAGADRPMSPAFSDGQLEEACGLLPSTEAITTVSNEGHQAFLTFVPEEAREEQNLREDVGSNDSL